MCLQLTPSCYCWTRHAKLLMLVFVPIPCCLCYFNGVRLYGSIPCRYMLDIWVKHYTRSVITRVSLYRWLVHCIVWLLPHKQNNWDHYCYMYTAIIAAKMTPHRISFLTYMTDKYITIIVLIVQTLSSCVISDPCVPQTLTPWQLSTDPDSDSFLVPCPQKYVRHALQTLGVSSNCCGYWPHGIFVSSIWYNYTHWNMTFFDQMAFHGPLRINKTICTCRIVSLQWDIMFWVLYNNYT